MRAERCPFDGGAIADALFIALCCLALVMLIGAYPVVAAECVRYQDLTRLQARLDFPCIYSASCDVSVQDGRAYIIECDGFLSIYDVTNPYQPVALLRGYKMPNGAWDQSKAFGSVLIFHTFRDLYFMDMSNPASPTCIGSYHLEDPNDYIQTWVRIGTVFYLAVAHGIESEHNGRLVILDCANVQSPQQVGSIALGDVTYGLVAAGSCVGVTSPPGVISLYDVSDVLHPVCATTLNLPGYSCRAADGTTMAIAGLKEVVLMDVSDPWRATVIGTGTAPSYVGAVLLRGALAYATCTNTTLQVMDFSDPTRPAVVTPIGDVMPVLRLGAAGDGLWAIGGPNYNTVFFLRSGIASPAHTCAAIGALGSRFMGVTGSRACSVNDAAIFSVLDATDPLAPAVTGSIQLPGAVRNLAVTGDVSLAVIGNTLHVVDTSEPTAPSLRDTLYRPGGINDVAAKPGIAAILEGASDGNISGGITIVDTSNPDSLRISGYLPFEWGQGSSIAIAGSRAYVAWWVYAGPGMGYFNEIHVIDISVPSQPRLVRGVYWDGFSSEVDEMTATGELLFVNARGVVHMFDIADPDVVRAVGTLSTRGIVSSLALSGRTLYAAGRDGGPLVEMFDLTDVSHPAVLGNVLLGDKATSVAVIGDYVWLGENAGLEISRVQCATGVPIVLRRFVSRRDEDAVIIEWSVDDPGGVSTYRLEGRASGATWAVPFSASDPGAFRAEDRTPVALGGDPIYLLYHRDLSGDWTLLGETGPANDTPGHTLRLYSAAPNPFNPRTTIRFDLPAAGQAQLSVYDLAGRLVRVLVEGEIPAGSHEAVWDGRDSTGRSSPSGSYLARLVAGGKVEVVRMGLVR